MRYQLLIGFICLNMITCTEAMERSMNCSHSQRPMPHSMLVLVMPTIIVSTNLAQDNQPKQYRFYDQPDKKSFNKIVHDTKPKKGYTSERRLLAPRNKIRSK